MLKEALSGNQFYNQLNNNLRFTFEIITKKRIDDDKKRNDSLLEDNALVLADPEACALYEATKLQIELALQLKKARLKQKMTQEEVASLSFNIESDYTTNVAN